MKLIKVIPKLFYEDKTVGLDLFCNGLGFSIKFESPEKDFYVIDRDGVTITLVENAEYAAKDRPEIRIETDDIDALYADVKTRAPQLLHPNLKVVKTQPWGLREFALLDKTTVCVVIQQQLNG